MLPLSAVLGRSPGSERSAALAAERALSSIAEVDFDDDERLPADPPGFQAPQWAPSRGASLGAGDTLEVYGLDGRVASLSLEPRTSQSLPLSHV